MFRWLPWMTCLCFAACVLPAWPPPWADDDDTTGPGDDDAADDTSDDDTAMPDDDVVATTAIWVAIEGAEFDMGSNGGDLDEQPVRKVTVPTFEMLKTEVTIGQYVACMDVGMCSQPLDGAMGCEWFVEDREDKPVNCVNWQQATDYCTWAGGRLPSEAEWEFAARSRGQENVYPWGDEEATCEYAIMEDPVHPGTCCGVDDHWDVCSRSPWGDSEQGLCDLAGSVWEWVQDWYHASYIDAPDDGSAWESGGGAARVVRGGSCGNNHETLRAANRDYSEPVNAILGLGFRCARDL